MHRVGSRGSEDRGQERQQAASRSQRSDIRGLRSGIKLTSDLRLLISAIDDFNDLNGLNDFNGLPSTAYW